MTKVHAEEVDVLEARRALEEKAGIPPGGEITKGMDNVQAVPAAPVPGEFARTDSLGNALSPADASPPPAPRPEGPVDVRLLDGRLLTMQRPKQPIAVKVYLWLGERSVNPGLVAQYRALLYAHALDGVALPTANSEQDLAHRVNLLGDDGVDMAVVTYMRYWPPVLPSELPK